jgi:hypothetical protein
MCCRAPRLPFEIKTKMLCARALSSVQQQVSARKNKDEQQQPQPTTTAAAATTTTTATTTTAKTTPHSFSLRMMNREHVRRRRGVWSGAAKEAAPHHNRNINKPASFRVSNSSNSNHNSNRSNNRISIIIIDSTTPTPTTATHTTTKQQIAPGP